MDSIFYLFFLTKWSAFFSSNTFLSFNKSFIWLSTYGDGYSLRGAAHWLSFYHGWVWVCKGWFALQSRSMVWYEGTLSYREVSFLSLENVNFFLSPEGLNYNIQFNSYTRYHQGSQILASWFYLWSVCGWILVAKFATYFRAVPHMRNNKEKSNICSWILQKKRAITER